MKNYLLILFISVVLLQSCDRFDLKMYDFSALPAQPEQRLEQLADTSTTLKRLDQLDHRKQVDSLIFFAEWLKNYDEEVTLQYAQKAYELSTDENWTIPRAISAYRLAWSKGNKAQFGEDIEDAMVDAQISKRLLEPYQDPLWQMEMSYLFGHLFRKDNQLDSARFYFQNALQKLDRLPYNSPIIQQERADLLGSLATTYHKKDTTSKFSLYKQSDSLYKTLNNKTDRARLWLDKANIYIYHKAYQKADSLINLCMAYSENHVDYDLMALAYRLRGYLYQQKFLRSEEVSDFNLAISNLEKCLTFKRDYNYQIYELIGDAYQGSWASYIDDAHIDSAVHYQKLAFVTAKQEGAIKAMKRISSDLAYLCNELGEKHEQILGMPIASFLDQNYVAVSDSITEHARLAFRRINKIEQRDIKVSAASKRRNQMYIGLVILFLSAAIFLFFFQRAQNNRLKAEMNALRAQINPHFISNSLNAIENLVNGGETKAASKYLVHFSRLSRQILTGSRDTTTSLAAELKMLEHFLALEQLRFRDKLHYQIDVAADVDVSKIIVPAMILQPYVENAIWHGIKPKPDGGMVKIEVQKAKKELICMIEDDGIGREKSRQLKQSSVLKHKSMGMKITEERIRAMGRIKGSYVDIIDLKDNTGNAKGTKVILKLALKYNSTHQ